MKLRNPWEKQAKQWLKEGFVRNKKYVLEEDKTALDKWQSKNNVHSERKLCLHSPPVPYIGDLKNAKVLILLQNPGLSYPWMNDPNTENIQLYRAYSQGNNGDKNFFKANCENLLQKFNGRKFPFHFLNPEFCMSGGFRYWTRMFDGIIKEGRKKYTDATVLRKLSKRICVIQTFAYNSKEYKIISKKILASQKFNIDLFKKYVKKKKYVLIRGKSWERDLHIDPHDYKPRNAFYFVGRNTKISKDNLGLSKGTYKYKQFVKFLLK